MRKIDFTNPILGRRWLSIFNSTVKYGLLFRASLELPKQFLNFSFRSNKFGLRGHCDQSADNVLSGTSFAMGMSVDNGLNWYELSDKFESYFNIGMPVSIVEQSAVLNDFYQGKRKHLIYVYHPNFWLIARQFYASRTAQNDVASHMQWKTARSDVPRLTLRWMAKSLVKRLTGKTLYRRQGKLQYKLDTLYCKLAADVQDEYVRDEMRAINSLCETFEKVTFVRVPIKEQLYFYQTQEPALADLNASYDDNWQLFKTLIEGNCQFVDLCHSEQFELKDYLPYDTHWNVEGNRKFHDILVDHLDSLNINETRATQ